MELSVIHAIQSIASPFWDVFFEGVTILAEQYLMIIIFCYIYWIKDKEQGKLLAMSLALTLPLNNIIKNIFNAPRPIGEPGVRSLRVETATGPSFPSGHTQSSSTAYWTVSGFFGKKYLRILAAVLIVLIALSRVYLGVHWPRDVIAGMVLGIGCAYAASFLFKKFKKHDALFITLSVVILIFTLLLPSKNLITSAGLAFGMAPGFFIEGKYVRFGDCSAPSVKVKRFAVGIAVILAVYLLPKLILPDIYIFRFIRYALVSFSAVCACPAIFVKLKI